MFDRANLHEGMIVRSADGDKLGKIVRLDDTGIQIEKGLFFPKEYLASYEQIDQISGDGVYLNWGTDLVEQHYDQAYGAGKYREETADENLWTDYRRGDIDRSEAGEQRIQLKEEELAARKSGMKEVGRVRIYKTVRTEDKTFTVPVTREAARIDKEGAVETGLKLGETVGGEEEGLIDKIKRKVS